MDQVLAWVERDQVQMQGWTLPKAFHAIDSTILVHIVMNFFGSDCMDAGLVDTKSTVMVDAPSSHVPFFEDAMDMVAQRLFFKRSVDAMFASVSSSWTTRMLDCISRGDLVIPVLDKESFAAGCLAKSHMLPLLTIVPDIKPDRKVLAPRRRFVTSQV
jgi:hypothetical protein